MTVTSKTASFLLIVFVFHQGSALQELCASLCNQELRVVERAKDTKSKVLSEACNVGCRMSRLDILIAWPASADGNNCLKSCADAFTQDDDRWACCVGCNTTRGLEMQNDDNLFEEESTTAAPSSYSSFFSFLYHAFFPSFFSFTNGNSMEIAIVTVDGDLGSGIENGSEHSYIYIVGSNADTSDKTEQVTVPSHNGYRLDTDWSDWGDHDDETGASTSSDCHELWFTLQVISVALILISFFFCCFNNSNKETQREREIVNCKEQSSLEHPEKLSLEHPEKLSLEHSEKSSLEYSEKSPQPDAITKA